MKMILSKIKGLFGRRMPDEVKRLITPEVARGMLARIAENPKRFPRWIRRRAVWELTAIAERK